MPEFDSSVKTKTNDDFTLLFTALLSLHKLRIPPSPFCARYLHFALCTSAFRLNTTAFRRRRSNGKSRPAARGELAITEEEVASPAPVAALDATKKTRTSRQAFRPLELLCCASLVEIILTSSARLSSTGLIVSASFRSIRSNVLCWFK